MRPKKRGASRIYISSLGISSYQQEVGTKIQGNSKLRCQKGFAQRQGATGEAIPRIFNLNPQRYSCGVNNAYKCPGQLGEHRLDGQRS